MQRRNFLIHGGLALGAVAVARAVLAQQSMQSPAKPSMPPASNLSDWNSVRAHFALDPSFIHMGGFYLASHPTPVRDAIERHRKALDFNPIIYQHEHVLEFEMAVHAAAGEYLGVNGDDVALTDSTTMGLATLYNAIRLDPGQEILTTKHDHWATWKSLELRAQRTGAVVRSIPLYEYGKSAAVRADEIVSSLTAAITPNTRILAVTWVHSVTGVKLPLRAIADALVQVNRSRDEKTRIILCVDGVHGLGIEDVSLPALGCDFFCAGTHKWMFGPRGTGIMWGRPEAQSLVDATIPPFVPYGIQRLSTTGEAPWGYAMTPGGFHSFEHRWALAEAFRFHQQIGKARIAQRIHELNRQLKEGMAKMNHITLHTPMSDELSAGIVCFEVAGRTIEQSVDRLGAKKIIASVSPYTPSYARLAPSLLVSPEEVEVALRELSALA